jgi:NAD(P)-dependent dehydrogenase (short-subunit alcohol dehydrogenase family)
MDEVLTVIGAGHIGQAIARRVGSGRRVLLADIDPGRVQEAQRSLGAAGYVVEAATIDVASRDSVRALAERASALGNVTHVAHTAGISPSQAPPRVILETCLFGTVHVLEAFGHVVASGGSGIVIASAAGHRLPPLAPAHSTALATAPIEVLRTLPLLQLDQIRDSVAAYHLAKRANSLRVMGEALRWSKRGARLNAISPGFVVTPLAKDELTGPHGLEYRRLIERSPARRAGTPDEVAHAAAYLMSSDASFITGSDFLIDGGLNAAYWCGGGRRPGS